MTVEFSRMFDLSVLKRKGSEMVKVKPKEVEYKALIKRLDVIDLKDFEAEMTVAKDGKYVDVQGHIKAKVTQTCVITLEPVETVIDEAFETTLEEGKPKPQKKNAEEEIVGEIQEYFEGHKIDIGEIATQQLVLALPLYPRKKSAKLKN